MTHFILFEFCKVLILWSINASYVLTVSIHLLDSISVPCKALSHCAVLRECRKQHSLTAAVKLRAVLSSGWQPLFGSMDESLYFTMYSTCWGTNWLPTATAKAFNVGLCDGPHSKRQHFAVIQLHQRIMWHVGFLFLKVPHVQSQIFLFYFLTLKSNVLVVMFILNRGSNVRHN